MAAFINNDITAAGLIVLAKGAAGQKITYTKIVLGDGYLEEGQTPRSLTGVVTTDPARCVGCRTCVSMCPFGAVRVMNTATKPLAFKCDLCGDGAGTPGTPSCVAACPNRALIYVESEA